MPTLHLLKHLVIYRMIISPGIDEASKTNAATRLFNQQNSLDILDILGPERNAPTRFMRMQVDGEGDLQPVRLKNTFQLRNDLWRSYD